MKTEMLNLFSEEARQAYLGAVGDLMAVQNLLQTMASSEISNNQPVEGNTLEFLAKRMALAVEIIDNI